MPTRFTPGAGRSPATGQCGVQKSRVLAVLVPVVERWIALSTGYITMHWIAQLVFLIFIHWIVIYPVNSAIQGLNNRGLVGTAGWLRDSPNSGWVNQAWVAKLVA